MKRILTFFVGLFISLVAFSQHYYTDFQAAKKLVYEDGKYDEAIPRLRHCLGSASSPEAKNNIQEVLDACNQGIKAKEDAERQAAIDEAKRLARERAIREQRKSEAAARKAAEEARLEEIRRQKEADSLRRENALFYVSTVVYLMDQEFQDKESEISDIIREAIIGANHKCTRDNKAALWSVYATINAKCGSSKKSQVTLFESKLYGSIYLYNEMTGEIINVRSFSRTATAPDEDVAVDLAYYDMIQNKEIENRISSIINNVN